MPQSVRIGFVGTGGIAAHHLQQLREVEGAEIVALCDVVEERAREKAAECGAVAYADHRPMLERERLDALYVCVPPFAHEDAESLAAQRGVHLFVEKPVALTMEKGREVLAAIRTGGVMSSVGYSLRYLPATEAARRYLGGKTVAMVTADRWSGLPGGPWWRVMERSGGQLVEMTTHQVDVMRDLVGEIEEVHARYARRVLGDEPGVTVPDAQIVSFRFANGAIGMVTTSCGLTRGGGRSDMNFLLRDVVLHYTTQGVGVTPETAPQPPEVGDDLPNIDAAFVQAVRTGDPSPIRCDYAEGLRTLAVTLAANESARTGQPVRPELDF